MAVITKYTDAVSIEQVKNYLRLDESIDLVLETELTAMINAACVLVENYTQYYLKPQEKSYFFDETGFLNVYAFPIIGIVTPIHFDVDQIKNKGLYNQYYDTAGYSVDNTPLVLNVGYEDTVNVNPILIQGILETIRVWFYSAESDNQQGILPELFQMYPMILSKPVSL